MFTCQFYLSLVTTRDTYNIHIKLAINTYKSAKELVHVSHMQEPAYFIWLVLQIGAVNFPVYVGREVSGIVCSHVNLTYPYLPPLAPTTYIKKQKNTIGWEINSCVTYTVACVIHWVCSVDKSPNLLNEHCYMFTKSMMPEMPLDCYFGRNLPGKCMLPRKPNKYMIRFHCCLSLPLKLQFLYMLCCSTMNVLDKSSLCWT